MMAIETLISSEKIQERIQGLAQEIERDRLKKELVVVGVLKGSFLFMADLVRQLSHPVTCDFLRMQSYDSEGKSTGNVRLEFDLTQSIQGRDVLLVEDIVDTGQTAAVLIQHIQEKKPSSVRLCALLHKEVSKLKFPIDYVGFKIPNRYVVG